MKNKTDIDYKTDPMAYDTLLATVRLVKEWYDNKEKIAAIKGERIEWYNTKPKCTCERVIFDYPNFGEYEDGGTEYDGTCAFCKQRNDFYNKLKLIANRQRAIKNKIRHRIKYCY